MSLWDPPTNPTERTSGRPSRIQIAQVVNVNADGTIDAKLLTSRTTKVKVPVPLSWAPQRGERCLLADRDGDPNQPISLGFFAPADGSLKGPTTRPATKPTVTGSRGGNAALTSLLAALASAGYITDNTTA